MNGTPHRRPAPHAHRASARWLLGAAAVTLLAASGDLLYSLAGAGRAAGASGHGDGSASSRTVQVLGEQQARPATNGGTGDPEAFTISGRVAGLYPGADVPLTLTFTNPNTSAIRVTQVSITVDAATPSCPSSLLSFGALPPVTVPGSGTAVGQISTQMSRTAGDACQGVQWKLSYSGQAVKA